MRISKRVVLSILLFVFITIFLSGAIIIPSIASKSKYYHDADVRKELAGAIDYIILGASQSLCSLVPSVIDEQLGCNSYNLSGHLVPAHGRYYLLNKEIHRNPVDTVILEIAYDSFTRPVKEDCGGGEVVMVERTDSISEALHYMRKYVALEDWLNIYSRLLSQGVSYYRSGGKHKNDNINVNKGFHAKNKANDLLLRPEEVVTTYNAIAMSTDMLEENMKYYKAIIDECKKSNVQIKVIVTPISDRKIWQTSNMDEIHEMIVKFARDNDCDIFDFNLLKDRYIQFNDMSSYYDETHLSYEGAMAFTDIFCRYITKNSYDDDVCNDFYTSYEEMREDSPYMHTYLQQNQE